jgi:hypothetical protein
VSGSVDGIVVSAARGPQGELTILALNTTEQPHKVTIAGIRQRLESCFLWNQVGEGLLRRIGPPAGNSGSEIMLEIPPQALLAGTTRKVNDFAKEAGGSKK